MCRSCIGGRCRAFCSHSECDLAPAKPVDERPLVRLGLPVRCLGVDNSPQLAAHFGDNCGARRIARSVDGLVRVGIEIK